MATETTQSVERAVDVLRAVARGGGSPVRLAEVTIETGLTKSTAHRLLLALVKTGLLEQDAGNSQFVPGFDLLPLGAAAGNRYGLVDLAAPCLRRLAEDTEDTVYLSVRDGDETVVVERVEGRFPIKALSAAVGERRPLGIGAGSLAILAFLDSETVERIFNGEEWRERYPGFDRSQLEALVRETRDQGYAFATARVVAGMAAIGVPIRERSGDAIASLSIAAITERFGDERREEMAGWLRREAGVLEERLASAGIRPHRFKPR